MSDSDLTNTSIFGTIIKLIIASLIVGLVIHWLDITPRDVLDHFGETVAAVYNAVREAIGWASNYVITGALIVLPVWAIAVGLNYLQRKSRRK